MDKLDRILEQIRDQFDEEGWYCVLADSHSFNQNPDLYTDFDKGFDYKDVKALSIIDLENRLVMNSYFYILDDDSFCLMGDTTHNENPVTYKLDGISKENLIEDVKRVINYY
ncbi:MAG: hypothetical protein GWO07_12355 [Candidatus Dadabacteria bacterium]|nr:hypothetical protein [Candidatus Dadabacteria bacterium]NIS09528.1 hypothetical protein [Candidatus Dadabacteria bacterium]NIV42740.1 hypothetical protein [Candidatus Dadabacteria bacterium]NIX16634.1 hypothetical protein [Candidatus Dadabacteria bacterium]NIY23175.1 hypothetical protein [Candidatus Dadabacteria bacterium]